VSVHAWGSGRVFQNFADPDLEHWATAYYDSNYSRLVRVKATYDASDLFRFQQSLPPPLEERMSEDNKAVIRRLVAEVLNASASSTAPLRGSDRL
jgi:Berberine and berberine like